MLVKKAQLGSEAARRELERRTQKVRGADPPKDLHP